MRATLFPVFAVVFTLAMVEGSLRLLDLPRVDTCWAPNGEFWVPDPELGFAYKPGMQVAKGVVNELGLRGPVPPREKPPGHERILYVGDSTAYGFGVADDEAFWSLATRAVESRRPASVVEPLVAAAPGYSTYQSRLLLDRMLLWRPDWVVFYLGAINDHRPRVYYPDSEIPARMARRQAAWHRVRTLRAFEFLVDHAGAWISTHLLDAYAIRRVPPPLFDENLRAMIAATRAAGARPLLLIPPVSDALVSRHPEIPAYQAILKHVAAELDVPAIDLSPVFGAGDPKAMYLPDDEFHPSPLGHRLIADAIAQAIEP